MINGISSYSTVQATQKKEPHTFKDQEFISFMMNTADITQNVKYIYLNIRQPTSKILKFQKNTKTEYLQPWAQL
jgi:hypothetical protein